MLFPYLVRMIPRPLRLLALCLAAICIAAASEAQELAVQPTPFTVLLDFAALRAPAAPKPALPIWLESVNTIPATTAAKTTGTTDGENLSAGLPEAQETPHTTIRIRLRSMPGLNDTLLLRLFFDDLAAAHPTVTAWSETAVQSFTSGPLGAGLELPVSESMSIPTQDVAYLDIDVSGDGSNLRKVLLTTLKKSTVSQALDFAPAAATATSSTTAAETVVIDPFGNPAPQPAASNDTYLFGRVRATLEAGFIKLAAPTTSSTATATATESGTTAMQTSAVYEFELEAAPLLALVTLDILNADPLAPLQAWINDTPVGVVSTQLADLADPAYVGRVRPLETMRFHYAGWLHGQVILPSSALKAGVNTLTLQLPSGASPVAIRAIELQLKHNWRILDYQIAP